MIFNASLFQSSNDVSAFTDKGKNIAQTAGDIGVGIGMAIFIIVAIGIIIKHLISKTEDKKTKTTWIISAIVAIFLVLVLAAIWYSVGKSALGTNIDKIKTISTSGIIDNIISPFKAVIPTLAVANF